MQPQFCCLSSHDPQTNALWGLGQIDLLTDVLPGTMITFSFNIIASLHPRVYKAVEDKCERQALDGGRHHTPYP